MRFETRYLSDDSLRFESANDKPRIAGYGIVFNKWSELISEDGIRFYERIAPESVRKVLTPDADIRALVNHDDQKVLGRSKAGTLTYRADVNGVYVEIFPPDTSYARDVIESIRRGDITGMSFRYRSVKGTDTWDIKNGIPYRTVNQMEALREFSPVTFPAFPDTSVSIRALIEADTSNLDILRKRLELVAI